MIGNVIQDEYLVVQNYPTARRAVVLADGDPADRHLQLRPGARHRGRARGGGRGMTAATLERPVPAASGAAPAGAAQRRQTGERLLHCFTWTGCIVWLALPIAVMIAFSFNNPHGRYNYSWIGFTFKWYGSKLFDDPRPDHRDGALARSWRSSPRSARRSSARWSASRSASTGSAARARATWSSSPASPPPRWCWRRRC